MSYRLLEVLWSCRKSCWYTPPIAHSEKSFRASNVYYEIVKKRMSLQYVKKTREQLLLIM